ncbi:GxxExxY protein [candidate division KSB1 bacterium]|nr:GxxExxY protein [candidate division KSB1 bacterium]NIR71589.1 GxxExxY protein [candidate division KSB1 bacterium]NIS27971.1 GxxExxY protein [candidate division KSB1 bacterium]NIT74853.1 GxxExxY protein [candidate division KSB1 bacterium]NIU28628.1 GxxExxY protein [candidate division KSB1 bacterium]
MTGNQSSYQIIGAAMEVHRNLRSGQLESAYQACLCYELQRQSFHVERQCWLPMRYKNVIAKKRCIAWIFGSK